MKKILILAGTVGSIILYSSSALSNNDNDRTTFLGPTLKGRYTRSFSDLTAFSFLGEAGLRNFRVGGTFALKIQDNQALKVSGEYLWQEIFYSFFNSHPDEWVKQGAIGAGYEYNLYNCAYDPSFDINAYYSHAPSKNLDPITGFFGRQTTFTDFRRIAGSNAAGISPGINFHPWRGGKAGIDLNYDRVNYDNTFDDNDEDARGLGATIHLQQFLRDDLLLGASAAIRRPFNNYEASLAWTNIPYYGHWALGIDGAYTSGKNELPNTYNIGLTADYFVDQPCESIATQREMAEHFTSLKGEVPALVSQHGDPHFLAWAATPAIYQPQVLAIRDEGIVINNRREPRSIAASCSNNIPTAVGTLAQQQLPNGIATTDIPTAQLFTGSNLTFSQTSNPPPPNTVSINPATGVVTVNSVQGDIAQIFTVTVTATNQCGSASTSFEVRVPGGA